MTRLVTGLVFRSAPVSESITLYYRGKNASLFGKMSSQGREEFISHDRKKSSGDGEIIIMAKIIRRVPNPKPQRHTILNQQEMRPHELQETDQ